MNNPMVCRKNIMKTGGCQGQGVGWEKRMKETKRLKKKKNETRKFLPLPVHKDMAHVYAHVPVMSPLHNA